MTGGPSSSVASASLFGVGGGNGSRCEGSASPVSSPIPPVENTNKDPITIKVLNLRLSLLAADLLGS